jgi:hypothetical protein
MNTDKSGLHNLRRAAAGLTLLAGLAVGLGACGGGGTTRATTAAAVTPLGTTGETTGAGQPAASTAATPAPSVAATPAPTAAPSPGKAPAPAAAKAAPSTPKPTGAPAPAVTAPAPTTPALPARRQPSAAEVNGLIGQVHALIPLFTPTAAQINQVGNDVCTAFDQGKTLAQVKATAMQLAGAYAALIPVGVTDTAVRTVVSLFCPGYTSKLG